MPTELIFRELFEASPSASKVSSSSGVPAKPGNECVYGTQVPRYHFEYQLLPAEGGKVKLHMTITQSEVDERFLMLVPVFADFGKGMICIGQVRIAGNSTCNGDVLLPAQPKKVALNAYKDILER